MHNIRWKDDRRGSSCHVQCWILRLENPRFLVVWMVLRIQCLEQEILRDMNWDILLICGVEMVVHIQSQAPTCLLSIREPINFMLRILLACTHGKKYIFHIWEKNLQLTWFRLSHAQNIKINSSPFLYFIPQFLYLVNFNFFIIMVSSVILINEMIEIMELKLRLYKSWGTKVLN